MATSTQKKKATAKEHATRHAASERRGKGASERVKVPASQKQRSQGRFPGERPLSGEDRPANRPGANLAGVAVSSGADRIFLMGYDFHWSGSDPGGSTPIERLDGGPSLLSAMALYRAAGIPSDQILLGLPLYGMAWPVASPDRYAERIGPGRVWLPSKHVSQLTAGGFVPHLDPLEVSEYLSQVVLPTATDPAAGLTWRAIFYDSPRTLRAKVGIARAAGYAGGGFWALGYERGLPGYAALMADFVGGRVDPAPADPAPPPGSVPLCRGLC